MIARRTRWVLGLGWATGLSIAALGGSCVGADPDHCKNQDGDASCEAGWFCNGCLASSDNKGCVEVLPEADCYAAGPNTTGHMQTGGGTSTGGTAGAKGSTGTDGGTTAGEEGGNTTLAVDCVAEGERDPECPEAAPFCVEGSCADCTSAGGDSYCADAGGGTPTCGPTGDCVECMPGDDTACGGSTGFCSPVGECTGCFEHAQCGTAGCDLLMGVCLPEGLVKYVTQPYCDMESGFGTMNQPWCNLDSVQNQIDGFANPEDARITLHVRPGSYNQPLVVSGGAVLVVLGDDGAAMRGTVPPLQATDNGRIFTQNMEFPGASGDALSCDNGGSLWLKDTRISGAGGFAINAGSQCDVTVDRSTLGDCGLGGIRAQGADITLLSSTLMLNQDSGVRLQNGGSLVANHATIIQNPSAGTGSNIRCISSGDVTIANSIVMQAVGPSFSACSNLEVRNSVVDAQSLKSGANGVVFAEYSSSLFVVPKAAEPLDPHVAPGDSVFDGVAVRESGPPYVDIDGEVFSLVPGASNTAGCDAR